MMIIHKKDEQVFELLLKDFICAAGRRQTEELIGRFHWTYQGILAEFVEIFGQMS